MLLALALAILVTACVALVVPAWRRPAVAVVTVLGIAFGFASLSGD
jgi:hypothetical protein